MNLMWQAVTVFAVWGWQVLVNQLVTAEAILWLLCSHGFYSLNVLSQVAFINLNFIFTSVHTPTHIKKHKHMSIYIYICMYIFLIHPFPLTQLKAGSFGMFATTLPVGRGWQNVSSFSTSREHLHMNREWLLMPCQGSPLIGTVSSSSICFWSWLMSTYFVMFALLT